MLIIFNFSLKVIGLAADGASHNRRFFKMHSEWDEGKKLDGKPTFRVKNPHADRYIYFISDPPHLLKTGRNSLLNSGKNSIYYIYFFQNKIDHIKK